jgi:hypothetical protein
LTARQRVAIRIEHEARGSSIAWHISWSSDRQMRQALPSRQLFPQ